MKIFSSSEMREWDQYTILNEPVSSINLMERAAQACTNWIEEHFDKSNTFHIFCGPGNNGGDGFAIARQLQKDGYTVQVYDLIGEKLRSEDNSINYNKLVGHNISIDTIQHKNDFAKPNKNAVIVDALFGSGLNRPPDGLALEIINFINQLSLPVLSVDIPSGLFADQPSHPDSAIHASYTLSFQVPKLCFFIPENERLVGDWQILDIGLHEDFYRQSNTTASFMQKDEVRLILKKRSRFGHKGSYGHAALVAGSYGMLGAAMLAGQSCLRSGVGKLTIFCSASSYPILQSAIPEAIFQTKEPQSFAKQSEKKFNAIGIGPGIGIDDDQKFALSQLFSTKIPLIIDADALNIIATDTDLMKSIPAGSILTPHLKEMERLFGKTHNGFLRLEQASAKAKLLNIYIVVKGHYSFLATPDGFIYFNSTGNPGMATAGSGDVLTGIITGLAAQGYSAKESCILGMWLHGAAGDEAAAKLSQEGMIAGDIVHFLPQSFKKLT